MSCDVYNLYGARVLDYNPQKGDMSPAGSVIYLICTRHMTFSFLDLCLNGVTKVF